MTVVTITEFLLARIAEDDNEVFELRKSVLPAQLDEYDLTAARVLAESSSKRRIVEKYQAAQSTHSDQPVEVFTALGEVLELLAAVYDDHPDYRATWRP